MLRPEFNFYNDFCGLDFDRVVILTMGSHILDDGDNLEYLDCHDRVIRPGQAYLMGIKLADGDYYPAGNFGDEDDDGSPPTPISPYKLSDYANLTTAARKRQRTSVSTWRISHHIEDYCAYSFTDKGTTRLRYYMHRVSDKVWRVQRYMPERAAQLTSSLFLSRFPTSI